MIILVNQVDGADLRLVPVTRVIAGSYVGNICMLRLLYSFFDGLSVLLLWVTYVFLLISPFLKVCGRDLFSKLNYSSTGYHLAKQVTEASLR